MFDGIYLLGLSSGGGSAVLGTLGLGSTVGLLVIAGMETSSTSNGEGNVISMALGRVHHAMRRTLSFLKRIKFSEAAGQLLLLCIAIFLLPFVFLWDLAELPVLIIKEYRDEGVDFNWRNFCKFLRIFKVWEPLPYDLMAGRDSADLEQAFEDKTHLGLVGVCLRFRTGDLSLRISATDIGRSVYGRRLSVPTYLPLEKDGSLRVDSIREEFSVEEVELLIPRRWRYYRVTKGDVISPLMMRELTEEFNCINVVEHEDILCQHRRHFREWLREGSLNYPVRVFSYIITFSFLALSGPFCAVHFSCLHPVFRGKLWLCFCNVLGFVCSILAIMVLLEYRMEKYQGNIAWHTFPRRDPPYQIKNHLKHLFL